MLRADTDSMHTHQQLNVSKRPIPIRLYNFIGQGLKKVGLGVKLEENSLIKTARKQTGLEDFGEGDFITPLNKLLQSIREEAKLHAFGEYITKVRLLGILHNRLRANYYFKKHPEILEQEIDPLLVITGLQRTGTTKLHRLLASDSNTRALLSWEALNPAPIIGKESKDLDSRIAQAKTSERGLRYISRDFFAIHPVEYNAPEEEILLLDNSFISTVPEATMHVPSFAAWVEQEDQTPAYEMMKKMLKLLQWQNRKKRWILKTPHHLEFLDTLCKVFPGTKIIQTHRNPVVTLASFCSMVYHGSRIFSDQVSPEVLGEHWHRKIKRMLQKAMDFRLAHPEVAVMDIYYKDLIANALQEVQKIYDFAGIEFTDEVAQQMQQTINQNPPNKYGVHKYQLNDFGLNESLVKEGFVEYFQKFGTDI